MVSCKKALIACFFVLAIAGVSYGLHELEPLWKRESLTGGFFGLNKELEDKGIEFGFALTNVYQQNVRGGLSKHDRSGRLSGSYDLEVLVDMEKLLGFDGGRVYLLVEGGWPDTAGINDESVGSSWGINADAIGNETAIVKELYYICQPFGEASELMVGKIDFTGYFDAAKYANDEITQFLNAAFVDNPAIPFPEYSLGLVLTYYLNDDLYLMGGIADAQADGRETGFRTAFCGEDYYFYILESGLTARFDSANGPLEGTYRAGLWNDAQPKANTDSADAGKSYRDDVGFYLSFDQMLKKENNNSDDEQGLGAFFRYGYSPSRTNDITNFWSLGFQYLGLFEGRDKDVLGLAFGQGFFSDSAKTSYTADYESVMELYYSAEIAPWLVVSPSIQYITNPGGNDSVSDAVVIGGRVLIIF